jgi:transcriptional regulator of arginine metabolism
MTQLSRQGAILELVKQGPMPNHDELRRELSKRGFRVTQATLSRDIHKLGLVKMPQGYTLPQVAASVVIQPALHAVDRVFREFAREVRQAQNLLVVKTSPGSAQPVAAAWDAQASPDIIGTVAGDDTILVICPDKRIAQRLAARLRGILA